MDQWLLGNRRRNRKWALCGALAGVVILLIEKIIHWLEYGIWPIDTVGWALGMVGLGLPQTSWVGLQSLIDTYDWNGLFLTVAALGAGIGYLFGHWTTEMSQRPVEETEKGGA